MEKDILNLTWNGPVNIVDAHELHAATGSGWKLLAVFSEEALEAAYDVEINPNSRDPNGYNHSDTLSTTHHHKCSRMKFMIGQDQESAMLALAADRDRWMTEAAQASNGLEEVTKEQQKLADALAKKQALAEAQAASLNTMRQQLGAEQARNRALEDDLAKVRQAVGDLRWSEILPPKPKEG